MKPGDDSTDPGPAPDAGDTDPGPAPHAASGQRRADPKIDDPAVAALLKGIKGSWTLRPDKAATTDGEVAASWSADARELQVAHPTPTPEPNVVLHCTEETPAPAVQRRDRDTDPTGRVEVRGGEVEEGVERPLDRATLVLPGRQRARRSVSLLLAIAALASIVVAGLLARGRPSSDTPVPSSTAVTAAAAAKPAPAPEVTATQSQADPRQATSAEPVAPSPAPAARPTTRATPPPPPRPAPAAGRPTPSPAPSDVFTSPF